MAARSPAVPTDPQLQRLAAEVAHMANKQSDYSTVLQAVQIDLHHVVKTMDTLASVAKEQIALSLKMAQHSDSIDRAFKTMNEHKTELAAAITKLSETLDKDRDGTKGIGETVTGYKAQLRLLYAIGSIILTLLVVIATMTTNGIDGRSALNREAIIKNVNDIEVLEAKMDRLRISDQSVVSDHERRLSRIESKGNEVAP